MFMICGAKYKISRYQALFFIVEIQQVVKPKQAKLIKTSIKWHFCRYL
jgi:hypothetical protein